MKTIYLLLIGGLLFTSCKQEKETRTFDILIKDANIVNTETGEILKKQSIGIIADTIAKIAAVDQSINWKANQTIQAKDKYVIPGLWDMHIHFGADSLIDENKNMLPLYLANGVTTVRDCAADISPSVLKWRKQIEDGELEGPNIFTAGPKLEGKNSIWPGDLEIENEKELTIALDSLDKLQVDFVKITDNALTPDLFLKSLKKATQRGYKTSGHIPFSLSINEVSMAGLSSIEHMSYMLKAGSARELEVIEKYKNNEIDYATANTIINESFDEITAVTKYRQLAENGTAIVPTLIGNKIISYWDKDQHVDDPELQYIGPGIIETYQWRVDRVINASAEAIEARHKRYQKLIGLIPLIKESGMPIIAGTDAGFLNSYIYPGFALHDELEIFQEAGLTALEALQTSVVNGPKYFGVSDKYGSVTEGKIADLLILNSNPIEDIKATKDINRLIKKNKVYNKTDLENMLQEVKELYN
ncbi:amidohydrolase family protein [Salegentibacter maritimus]|uniref:amidohydrolase family protein n=1 Tax=Salegentibacter maritimus TaxID=2794347 RepID=UPI0018E41EDA|nr:amidohydrolase family protein [Salegentibacter maritimus]MBI6116735.1 amidohydrolase family protein [Salegentibacter maritimus]